MKLTSFIRIIVLIALIFLVDTEARRGGGSSRSGGSSRGYSGGYSGGSSRGGSTTRRTTYTVRRGTGRAYGGAYHTSTIAVFPIGYSCLLCVGTSPYYNSAYGYYYNGSGHTYYNNFPPQKSSPIVVIIIVVVVILIICICIYMAQNSNGDGDDYEEETIVVEETTYNDAPRPQLPIYAPGTNPPGTALCNTGHIFANMYNDPYRDGNTPECDNCQR